MSDQLPLVKKTLEKFGNPQLGFFAVHITGTNGKGSTGTILQQILIESGLKVGYFSSPHVFHETERIKINNQPILEDRLADYFQKIELEVGGADLGYFAKFWLAAALYFAEKAVDIAVVEVGVGGRLDPTNCVDADVVLLTNVSLDHQELLGDTLEAILLEKLALVKADKTLVASEVKPDLLNRIQAYVSDVSANLVVADHQLLIKNPQISAAKTKFEFLDPMLDSEKLELNMAGEHQLANVTLAIKSATVLSNRFEEISSKSIVQGAAKAFLALRLEFLSKNGVTVLLDGAHNEGGVKALAAYLSRFYLETDFHLLFGVSKGRSPQDLIKPLLPFVKSSQIVDGFYEATKSGLDFKTALDRKITELQNSTGKEQIVLVAGSLYLTSEVRKKLTKS